MAKIATCPKCAKQLGLPAAIAPTDRAECPECHAIFSLSETVQIALPVVRVLDPAEQPAATTSSLPVDAKENASEALASNAAPIKSWEERLKNALALDSSADAVAPETAAQETTAIEKNRAEIPAAPIAPVASSKTKPSPSPSFEFELDPTPPASPEPVTPQKISPAKTLADFAPAAMAAAAATTATGALAGLAAKLPKVEMPEVELPKVDLPKVNLPSVKLPKVELPKKHEVAATVERATAAVHATTEKVEATVQSAVQTVTRRRVGRSAFPKIAAMGVGAAVGIFGGLYGLLWVPGAQTDLVGLARVLPASLLPEGFGGVLGESDPLAETSAPGLMAKLRERPAAKMKQDAAVLPASVSQPMSQPMSPLMAATIRIDAEEFAVLIDAAEAALPEFVAGDLSTPGAIKRKGQAYMALCRLSENFDFAMQPGLAPKVQAQVERAMQLYVHTARQAELRQDLAHIAGRWWEYDKRPSPGIFLVGEVEEVLPAVFETRRGTLCWVKPGGDATAPAIPVWLTHDRYKSGDQIGVVGSVISDSDNFPQGFSGSQVVAAKHSFAL